ncbi:MAG: hypothetical protein GWO23_25550, partial [Gammaproteobacteria bacterium]|nr:hypothetical protein [Gammaproteobacteria bacterium]
LTVGCEESVTTLQGQVVTLFKQLELPQILQAESLEAEINQLFDFGFESRPVTIKNS